MAIVIPSKHIYKKENQKVIDNAIERIEVNAVEVVPDNDYETPVYNDKYEVNGGVASLKETDLQGSIYGLTGGTYSASACYVSLTPYYSNNIEIHIPIVSNNKYIDDLLLGVDKDNNENIKLRIVGSIIKKNATATMDYSGGTANMKISNISYSNEELISSNQAINISSLKETYDLEYIFGLNQNSSHIIAEVDINQKELSINATYSWNATANSSIKINSLSNIYSIEKATPITINGVEYYKIELKVLCGVEYDILAGNGFYYRDETHGSEIWEMKGVNYKYTPEQLEITVYGNTIGIDLQDKTVYINGDTSKKVYSIDGNELMQTNNLHSSPLDLNKLSVEYDYSNLKAYIVRNDIDLEYEASAKVKIVLGGEETSTKNVVIKQGETRSSGVSIVSNEQTVSITEATKTEMLIKKLYSTTQQQYANGKETATIRCSISDYYDHDTKDKVISIDGGALPMKFNLYDVVIPMVYGYDGKDRPMSLYKDGTPKRFQVLGTKIYYDGAVWQELSLQEI